VSEQRNGLFHRLYHGETTIDFIGRTRRWLALSAVVIIIGMAFLADRGLNLGIDFEGGTAWEVKAPGVSVTKVRETLDKFGLADAKIQVIGGDTIRVQDRIEGEGKANKLTDVRDELSKLAGGTEAVSVNDVGPSWGSEITSKARRALVVFLIAIAIYITLRFEWKMALATLAALVHDILVTVGVYAVFGFPVTPATVVALLTILGYSIYDGIVVFDKVEENTRGLAATGRMRYGDMVNLSLNQVLMRTLNTSITALLPVASLLIVGAGILGATTLQEFALALLVGLLSGAYSSIFIASPILAFLKEREPRYRAIAERLASRAGSSPLLTPAAAAAAGGTAALLADEVPASRPRPTPPGSVYRPGGQTAPRGRKTKKPKRR
jgi:preprotein translocase subunit SecF